MSVIKSILHGEMAKTIVLNILELEGRSNSCAQNAIKYLQCADYNARDFTSAASFCATHATEEAVVSFLWAVKQYSEHKVIAKKISPKDHKQKALVSIYAARLWDFLADYRMQVAKPHDSNSFYFRMLESDGNYTEPKEFHLNCLHFSEDTKTEHERLIQLGDRPTAEELI